MIKVFAFSLTLFFSSCILAQKHQLIKLWQTDTLLRTPESVLFNSKNNFLYVSNINGDASVKDGNGSIGKVDLNGKIINVDWVKGLNAPKGMGLYDGKLFVADIDEVVEINTTAATIENRIPVKGAMFLNDIAINDKGIIYVSDTRMNKVYRIENGEVKTVAENITGANGLFCIGDDLYVLSNGVLLKITKNKMRIRIADGMESSTDGLESVNGHDFLVSCWVGAIYYVKVDGSKEKLLDTQAQKINSADIGYDPVKKIVYVPNFLQNRITAYQLK
ncbi:MAG: ATP/GTP-binding protein [Bacteroidetes bacterium]|nr:ATP/GTP-binding protein [Bacteroidota bacterium]MBS1930322.1 ATP/GTP-binding protein [Bacteroidota bacterium]